MAVKIKHKGALAMEIFVFGKNKTTGNASMKNVLGGKGANLAEMALLGLPVPPGFTIPCAVSTNYQKVKSNSSELVAFRSLLKIALNDGLDHIAGHFDDGAVPLLSVRSGARVSMPGMMDTILNIGLTSETLPAWRARLGDRAALDCYRRLIQMYSSVALTVPMSKFEDELEALKESVGVSSDSELDAEHLERLVSKYLSVVEQCGYQFPDTLQDQLLGAVGAVFESWNNPRAVEYRKIHGYSDSWGTAVNVQAMVFGNLNDQSATGVLFTRCPSTGASGVVGEFLVNAQGEDVVAGIRTPEPLQSMFNWNKDAYSALLSVLSTLEGHYKDMQDVEFTVQDGSLYILQTRSGKRTPKAAFKIAHDLCVEGVVSKKEALKRVSSKALLDMMTDHLDPGFKTPPSLVGIAAGGGVVSGTAVFSSEAAVKAKANGVSNIILIRKETDPDDIAGMNASVGILTATGGLTSHAAVVARGMNKSCVVGATSMSVYSTHAVLAGGEKVTHGEVVTIDGASGHVWVGVKVPVLKGEVSKEASAMLAWATVEAGAVVRVSPVDGSLGPSKGAEALYIDTALMESLDAAELAGRFATLGSELEQTSSNDITINLACLSSLTPGVDAAYDFMFGLGKAHDEMTKAVLMCKWPDSVIARCSVSVSGMDPSAAKVLRDGGFAVFGKASNVDDLLNANGPMEVPEHVISSVFGSKKALDWVMGMIEQTTGKALSGSMPLPKYWFEVLEA